MMFVHKSVLLLLMIPVTAHARQAEFDSEAVDRAVTTEMERQKIVGAAIGVIRRGKVVYTQGYGFSNLEKRTPTDTTTIFNWASNSKPVMAVAALQLVQRGQLDLDASIRSYLPEVPESWAKITTRHLLCHQSGIPHYTNGKVVPTAKKISLVDQTDPVVSLHRFLNSPLLYLPGAKMTYSSHAYVLLSAVVQAAGKERMSDQLLHRIGKPLGWRSFQLDMPFNGQKHWTTAYRMGSQGSPVVVNDTAHFWKHGAGGYKSNIRDFAAWAAALMNHMLIRKETAMKMWSRQTTTSGELTDYGLGVRVSGEGKNLIVTHGGSQDETKTRMVIYPRLRHGLVVLCNTASAKPERITTSIYHALNAKRPSRCAPQ